MMIRSMMFALVGFGFLGLEAYGQPPKGSSFSEEEVFPRPTKMRKTPSGAIATAGPPEEKECPRKSPGLLAAGSYFAEVFADEAAREPIELPSSSSSQSSTSVAAYGSTKLPPNEKAGNEPMELPSGFPFQASALPAGSSSFEISPDEAATMGFSSSSSSQAGSLLAGSRPIVYASSFFTFEDLLQGAYESELGFRIFGFMDAESRTNLACTSSQTRTFIIQFHMDNDPRGLSHKTWIDGPLADTLDNYLFNAAVWYLEKQAIIGLVARTREGSPLMPRTKDCVLRALEPLAIGYSRLLSRLCYSFDESSSSRLSLSLRYPEVTKRLGSFFASAYAFLKVPVRANLYGNQPSEPSFQVDENLLILAGNSAHRSEQALVGLQEYIVTFKRALPTQGFYADTETNLDRMSPTKRHVVAENKKISFFKQPERKEDWEYVERYALVLNFGDYEKAALSFEQTENYERAAELYGKLLTLFPDIFMSYTRAGNFFLEQKNHEGAAQIYEGQIEIFPNDVRATHFRDAAKAHYAAGNYPRAAALFEKLLARFPDDFTREDGGMAAEAHGRAGNSEREEEIYGMRFGDEWDYDSD